MGAVGEPEVVVGAEQHHRPAVEQDLRPLRALDQAQPAMQAGLPQLLQAGREVHQSLRPAGSLIG